MQNLKYLKLFIEEQNKDLYVEVNVIEKATIRPPCLILEPVKNRVKSKNKFNNFRTIYIDVEFAYNGILAFGEKANKIINGMEEHDMFVNNFEVIDRETSWETKDINDISYYSAITNYEINETLANKEDLTQYELLQNLSLNIKSEV